VLSLLQLPHAVPSSGCIPQVCSPRTTYVSPNVCPATISVETVYHKSDKCTSHPAETVLPPFESVCASSNVSVQKLINKVTKFAKTTTTKVDLLIRIKKKQPP